MKAVVCVVSCCPWQAEWYIEHADPPTGWPSRGAIKFDGYSTRYRPGLDLVLNKIDANVKAGEKVCCCDIPC